MEKIRPAIIRQIDEENNTVMVQKLTTKKHKKNKVFIHPKIKRNTYLSIEQTEISGYNLVRYIGNIKQEKSVKK